VLFNLWIKAFSHFCPTLIISISALEVLVMFHNVWDSQTKLFTVNHPASRFTLKGDLKGFF